MRITFGRTQHSTATNRDLIDDIFHTSIPFTEKRVAERLKIIQNMSYIRGIPKKAILIPIIRVKGVLPYPSEAENNWGNVNCGELSNLYPPVYNVKGKIREGPKVRDKEYHFRREMAIKGLDVMKKLLMSGQSLATQYPRLRQAMIQADALKGKLNPCTITLEDSNACGPLASAYLEEIIRQMELIKDPNHLHELRHVFDVKNQTEEATLTEIQLALIN